MEPGGISRSVDDMSRDCNSCHHARWCQYNKNIGKCVAPAPACMDHTGIRGISATRPNEDCPAFIPRIPWFPKKKLDF